MDFSEILLPQTDKNFAPVIYGMMSVKDFKPVHRELWAIIRDKQKYCEHGVLENAVQGFATLMNVGYSTIHRAIKLLKKHDWLLVCQITSNRLFFRAMDITKGKPPGDLQKDFETYVKMNVVKPATLPTPVKMNEVTPVKMNDNSTHPDNKTLLYPCRGGDNGKPAVQETPPPYKPSYESRTGLRCQS